MIEKLILGDNPFFGINHRSGDKAKEYSKIKSDFSVAANVVVEAAKSDITGLMVSTHAELPQMLDVVTRRLEEESYPKPKLSLVVPYAHKLNSVVADKGILGLLTLIRPHKLVLSGIQDLFAFVFKRRLFPNNMFREFIFSELELVDGYEVNYICFQNVVTDMILGIDKSNVFRDITSSLQQTNHTPVFITMNPIELDRLLPEGVPICFHYNLNGFMVQPDLESVQEFIRTTDRPLWAMGIMASGAVELNRAISDPHLKYFEKILYATSKPERLSELTNTISHLENKS